jgi:hypothetical protein
MSMRLGKEDRRAVDLLLERADGVGRESTPAVEQLFAAPVQGNFERRLDAVDKILSLLDLMPAPEPSADLVNRTMRRIEEADAAEPRAAGNAARAAAARAASNASRTHA